MGPIQVPEPRSCPSRRTRLAALAGALLAGLALVPVGLARAASTLPQIRHVFTIVLENEDASTTFGANPPAPYLATTLRSQGAYIPKYYGIGHFSLDNYVAMISGQAPNPATQADCGTFINLTPGTLGVNGQASGTGCVYPSAVPTVVGQLSAAHFSWRSYNQSMGADPTRESATCGHPALGAPDNTQAASATDQYATRHDPFVYFHSIIDDAASCAGHVVNLSSLGNDLRSVKTTPNYTFITPDLCADGHDATCANPTRPGGYAGINAFLSTWMPQILASPAYKQDGLVMILFDEAHADSTACCGEIAGPGSPMPGITGPGGGDTGAVFLSPFIAPGTTTTVPYNHYSMLRSVEDMFGLGHLGDAGQAGVASFGSDVFTRPGYKPPVVCRAGKRPRPHHGKLPANSVIRAVHVRRSHGRERLTFTGVYPGKLKVTLAPRAKHTRGKKIQGKIAACHSYTIGLPPGHWQLTILATVGRASQHASAHY
ncbi:MAG: alkaline phosphatase family protein [Actinomycetota bacterium]|nr:alkaline phosphatase family protein [Actinomycetota bacterium]